MRGVLVWSVATLFAALVHYTRAQCSNFVSIAPDDYDMNYYGIENADARPLGFARGSVSYNNPETNTCSRITGVVGHTVEIMFETVPPATLCVRMGDFEECRQTQYYVCQITTSDTVEVQFFCDTAQGCSESDVLFWYRITASDDIDDDGHWCFTREAQYPQGLVALPTNLPTIESEGDDGNSATSPSVCLGAVLSVALVCIAVL